jgi:dipeptidyl aminopeptidase/acylaminoacyl peptidase
MTQTKWDETTFASLAYLSDARISNDSKSVSYVLTKANLESNSYESTVVVENLESGEKRYIENASSPRFSPSGKRLIFVRMNQERQSSELWLSELGSASNKKALETKNVLNVSWNQDDRRLLVVSSKRRGDEDFFYEDNTPIWFNEKGFLDGERTVIGVYDSETGAKLEEFEEDLFALPYMPTAVWHGDSIVFNSNKRKNPFALVDVFCYRDGNTEKLFDSVSFRAADSNGKQLLLLGKPRKEHVSEHNYLYVWDGKDVVPLTQRFLYNNLGGRIDEEGNVYFLSNERGRTTLNVLSHTQKLSIVDEDAAVSAFDVNRGGTVVFIKTSVTSPNEVFVWRGKTSQLTNYNEQILKRISVRPSSKFTYRSADGLEIDGWFIQPENADNEKAPMLVFVHGGPKGMYGYSFDYLKQLFVSRGFYVLYTNPRGSDGYDEEFALRVMQRPGFEDFQDVLSGVDWAIKNLKGVDSERIGITGISYGGFMTNWAITQTRLFKAAVSENGISNWYTSYAFSDIGMYFDRDIVGEKQLESEEYRRNSPIFFAKNVETPVLLIHSLEDYRCPLDQSAMFYHVLKDLEKEAYIVVFKQGDHVHSIRGLPRHRMKRHRIILEFFTQKLLSPKEGFALSKFEKQ